MVLWVQKSIAKCWVSVFWRTKLPCLVRNRLLVEKREEQRLLLEVAVNLGSSLRRQGRVIIAKYQVCTRDTEASNVDTLA